jgi:hypothetical protein
MVSNQSTISSFLSVLNIHALINAKRRRRSLLLLSHYRLFFHKIMPPGVRPQVLNNAFQEAANQARQKLPELTSNQKVRSISFN